MVGVHFIERPYPRFVRLVADLRQRPENAARVDLRIFTTANTTTIASNAERQACASKPWNASAVISKFVMVCLSVNILPQQNSVVTAFANLAF